MGGLKLIRGYAGKPDGWIPPEDVLGLDTDEVGRVQDMLTTTEKAESEECSSKGYKVREGDEANARFAHYGCLKVRLYDISVDPTERRDLSRERPADTARLLRRLSELEAGQIAADVAHQQERFNPAYTDGVYSTGWCEAEPKTSALENDLADLVEVDVV